jgi:hypothetical protein
VGLPRRSPYLLVCLLGFAALLAACGGGDDGSTTVSSSVPTTTTQGKPTTGGASSRSDSKSSGSKHKSKRGDGGEAGKSGKAKAPEPGVGKPESSRAAAVRVCAKRAPQLFKQMQSGSTAERSAAQRKLRDLMVKCGGGAASVQP